jgi:CRP-like cAMP-binding protein
MKPMENPEGSQEFVPETPYPPYNDKPDHSAYSNQADLFESQITKKAHNKKHEEEKSSMQKFKEFFSANEVEVKKEDEEEEIQRNIKLKRIADLEKGDFFGEISLITKLRRTSSVFSASNVTCGFIPKSKFRQLLQDNHEFKDSITRYLHTYKDKNIRLLVTMIKNVPAFRTISVKSAKDITFALKNLTAPANENILRKGEISKKCFFVKEGCIDVMVR